MRKGTNPLRSSGANCYMPVVLTVVTHLPNLTGYHAERLEIVQTCLNTMRDNAEMETTVAVWDNGSCAELRDWLQCEYKPDMLILADNIGKTAARTSLIRMCPAGSIVGYSDDDMLFFPGWLAPQMDLLRHFPNVASVTGYPVRTAFRWGVANTLAWAGREGILEKGEFIPRQWETDFCISIDRDPVWHEDYTKNDTDYRVTYRGKKAYCTSHHCQFIGFQDTLVKAATYDGRAMGDEKVWDIALDNIGLRLATTSRLTRHMGNVIDDNLKLEVDRC
jgi:hypothetical protein